MYFELKNISQIFSLSISVNKIYCLFTSMLQENIIQLNCLAFITLNFLAFLELSESHHFKILFTIKHKKEVINFFLPRVEIFALHLNKLAR